MPCWMTTAQWALSISTRRGLAVLCHRRRCPHQPPHRRMTLGCTLAPSLPTVPTQQVCTHARAFFYMLQEDGLDGNEYEHMDPRSRAAADAALDARDGRE